MIHGGHCIAILGPTCSWKSEIALSLAEAWGAEIISCDSMQIYRGLDIGSAKPAEQELQRVKHHLIGCLELQERYDANKFVQAAEACLQQIWQQGKPAILVGGTGLYARALIYGFQMLPSDLELSQKLQAELKMPEGQQKLQAFVEKSVRNPAGIPVEIYRNPRRLLRACEVLQLTGKPPWELAKKLDQPKACYRQFCILPELSLLKERIRRRTEKMLLSGWVEEAQRAAAAGLFSTLTARQALGYREIVDFVAAGSPGGISALQELLSNRTIQYARRQLTWFKYQHPGAIAIPVENEERATENIMQEIKRNLPC
ncbi:MAG: tRNA (adenosine(37)-N6)-dimethylallyltransferase MiaA [Lentisphaeria bacterium]